MTSDALENPRRTIAVQRALAGVGIRATVGGALALQYHVADPRATRDIDVNVLVPKERARETLAALPEGPVWGEREIAAIERDGQVRLMWPVDGAAPLPLDLFFAEHDFHRVVTDRAIWVPMLDAEVPILTATDLVVFKALFSRPKDWVDIQYVVNHAPPSYDQAEAVRWLTEIVGADDERTGRVRALEPEEEKQFRWPDPRP
jgi:hypothetical protein